MPNHVTNIIEYSGDEKAIKKMLESIKNDTFGIGTIDFDKIIPMPKSLDIESGSRTDRGLRVYKDFIDVYTLAGTVLKDLLNIPKDIEDSFLAVRDDVKPEEWELGRTATQNILMYGAPTWYEWRIGHWGTKWNAYDYEDGVDYSEDDHLRFQTAWGAPHPVIARLAELYPDISFTHLWADEDIGQNCGRFVYEDGVRIEEYYPSLDPESIEFAAKVMDATPEDWNLYLNASGTKYIYAGEDGYELITLFDKPALFTSKRVTNVDIPKGLYFCHLRTSSDGKDFKSIEPRVSENCGGSIITSEPITFGDKNIIPLTSENAPDFLGTEVTLGEFLRENYDMPQEQDESGGMEL